jgi:murein DD-endopeptidase MepM/ murein hydrolase activator NlpD
MCWMERRLPLLLVLAAVLLLAAPAAGDPGDDKERVDSELGATRDQLEDAERQEGVLTEELSALTERQREAAAAVSSEEVELAALEADLARQQSLRREIEAQLAVLRDRLRVLRREERTALERLERRVRDMYMVDDPNLVGFVLGAESFSELVENIELLDRIGRQDESIALAATTARRRTVAATRRARRAREEALGVERVIARRVAEQRVVRDRLAAARAAVAAAQSAKRGALQDIRATESELHEEIEALEAESAALAAAIRAASPATTTAVTGNPSASGFVWPVSGPVVSGFGMRWGRMHEGIDISVGEGTPVAASAAGTVIYAGWLGGYGNLVVVDHGGGISTAYAHNSSYASSVGQSVEQGQVIAYSGNTGNSSGPHVHFEVRLNGSAVDPLGYL